MRYPVASVGSSAWTRSIDGRWNDETSTRSTSPPGREQVHDAGGHGLRGVEVGVPGRVLDLDVDEEPAALVEHLGQGRHPRERRPHRRGVVLRDDPEPLGLGVVVDHQRPVPGAVDVELHAVGTVLPGEGERLQGVLPRPPGRAPVAQDEWSAG